MNIKKWLLDLIFPIYCIGCGRLNGSGSDEEYICKACLSAIPLRRSFECIGCKRPVTAGATCVLCIKENAVDRLLVISNYQDRHIQKILKAFKYRFVPALAVPLNLLVAKYLRLLALEKNFSPFTHTPLVIPVPLHQRRENWRGFNQAELLAESLARKHQMPLETKLLTRHTMSTPQAEIEERDSRLENVQDAVSFAGLELSAGTDILLIDDICTTGATLNACARVLKANGARTVTALVVARG